MNAYISRAWLFLVIGFFAVSAPTAFADPTITTDFWGHDYGEVYMDSSSSTASSIRNDGDTPLTVYSLSFSGTNASDFYATGGTGTINPGSSLTFSVSFSPSGFGTRSAVLIISSNDPSVPELSFILYGSGDWPRGEISVYGLGVTSLNAISNGSDTTSTDNATDFGMLPIYQNSTVRYYQINNTSTTGAVHVTGISVSGDNPDDFGAASSLNYVWDTGVFSVLFVPQAAGIRRAIITIHSNDFDESEYSFLVEGSAYSEINVQGAGATILSGSTSPSLANNTDFAVAMLGEEEVISSFSIQNLSATPLTIDSIATSGTNAADFAVNASSLPLTVGGNSSEDFSVTFTPSNHGLRTATVTITNDDVDESSYSFAVQGLGSAPALLDPNFNPGANEAVNTVVMQPDDKAVVGGFFSNIASTARSRIARFNSDNTLDTGFNPDANTSVYCAAVQPDGKIIIGGLFTNVGGSSRRHIARINADGSLDTSFDPNANNYVHAIALQPDGKIIIAGEFTNVGGTTRNRIARLNSNGTLDTSFNPNANSIVYSLALQTDGKILVAGALTSVGGTTRDRIARLNTDGTVDTGFYADVNTSVYAMAVQPDDKIVIGGNFTNIGGVTRTRLARLNSDGSTDTEFSASATDLVRSISLQADGKIIIGGYFGSVNGATRPGCARLNEDGTTDTSFIDPDINNNVYGVTLNKTGEVYVCGVFTNVQSTSRNRIARLTNNLASETLEPTSSSRIEWQRSGAAPEAEAVTFELSTDGGSTWSSLGAGTRTWGGWEITGLSLPTSGLIRARAQSRGGRLNGSTSLLETIAAF